MKNFNGEIAETNVDKDLHLSLMVNTELTWQKFEQTQGCLTSFRKCYKV